VGGALCEVGGASCEVVSIIRVGLVYWTWSDLAARLMSECTYTVHLPLDPCSSPITAPQILPYLPVTISIPIPSDSVFTGVQEFRVVLSNTGQGMVFFTAQQTNIIVIDDDGELLTEGSHA
jgi:hypothetical protein